MADQKVKIKVVTKSTNLQSALNKLAQLKATAANGGSNDGSE